MATARLRPVAALAASLAFSLSLIYFTGFDPVNPVPVSWPPVQVTGRSGTRGYRLLLRKDPSLLTPARLRRLVGLAGPYGLRHRGRGQTIALVEEPSRLDWTGIDAFDRQFGLPPPVILTRYARSAGRVSIEETLDIEWVHAVIPLARIAIITLPRSRAPDLVPALPWLAVARDLGRLKPDVASASVIFNGWEATAALRQFAVAGVDGLSSCPFFAAAGDSGPAATFPGMLPGVIAVGGVSLTAGGPLPWPGTARGEDWLSFPRPPYQAGSSPWRTTPDVAFVAGYPGYAINIGGIWTAAGGASFAAPILAALWAAQMPGHLTADQAVALLYRCRKVPGAFLKPGHAGAGSGLGIPDFRVLARELSTRLPAGGSKKKAPAAAGFPPGRYPGPLFFLGAMALSVPVVLVAAGRGGRAPGMAVFLDCLIILAAWISAGPFSCLFTSADPLSGLLHHRWVAVTLSGVYAGLFTAAPVLVPRCGLPERLAAWLSRPGSGNKPGEG